MGTCWHFSDSVMRRSLGLGGMYCGSATPMKMCSIGAPSVFCMESQPGPLKCGAKVSRSRPSGQTSFGCFTSAP